MVGPADCIDCRNDDPDCETDEPEVLDLPLLILLSAVELLETFSEVEKDCMIALATAPAIASTLTDDVPGLAWEGTLLLPSAILLNFAT